MNTPVGSRGYAAIGLFSPKNPKNVACVLRAAGCYEAAMVAAQGVRYKHDYADTMRAYRSLPLMCVDSLRDVVPYDCVPIAVDLIPGARSLPDFTHPERGFYIFGPEDGTLGDSITSWCKHVVSIPTAQCMNLAATVNVVLYDRLMKQVRK